MNDPILLFINTSGPYGQLMLMQGTRLLAWRKSDDIRAAAERLFDFIEEVFLESGLQPEQLSAIAVLNGPGSYTGLRISLSTAKGLAYTFQVPMILLNKLHLLNEIAGRMGPLPFYTLVPARTNEYFYAYVEEATLGWQAETCWIQADALQELCLQKPGILYSDKLVPEFGHSVRVLEPSWQDYQQLILKHLEQKQFADLFHAEPYYLKKVFINKINKL